MSGVLNATEGTKTLSFCRLEKQHLELSSYWLEPWGSQGKAGKTGGNIG